MFVVVDHRLRLWSFLTNFFLNSFSSCRSGRGGDKDPSEGWYDGELMFYDHYVIPLARKLKDCGVFGVASAECLTYSQSNRNEWERKGRDIVERMKANYSAPKWAQSSSLSVASNDS